MNMLSTRRAKGAIVTLILLSIGIGARAEDTTAGVRVLSTSAGLVRVLDSPMSAATASGGTSYLVVTQGRASMRVLHDPVADAAEFTRVVAMIAEERSGPEGQRMRVLKGANPPSSAPAVEFPIVDLHGDEPIPVADFRPDVRYRRVP